MGGLNWAITQGVALGWLPPRRWRGTVVVRVHCEARNGEARDEPIDLDEPVTSYNKEFKSTKLEPVEMRILRFTSEVFYKSRGGNGD